MLFDEAVYLYVEAKSEGRKKVGSGSWTIKVVDTV